MISILTCSYNRDEYLPILYKSLVRQTSYNFEWVIIDDGSKDQTKKIVEIFRSQLNKFSITYYWKENGGKHTAINEGVKHVSGDWVFLVDSDDELTEDAIETVNQWIDELEKETDANEFAAVAGLRMLKNGKIAGGYPRMSSEKKYIEAKNNERQKYHLGGDKAEIYKTEILKRYPFPTFRNEKFLSEGAVWNMIAVDGFKIRWYPKVIYICDYLDNGLTKNNDKYLDSFEGFTYDTRISLKAFGEIYSIRYVAKYIYYAKKKGIRKNEIMNRLNISLIQYFEGVLISYAYTFANMVKRTN